MEAFVDVSLLLFPLIFTLLLSLFAIHNLHLNSRIILFKLQWLIISSVRQNGHKASPWIVHPEHTKRLNLVEVSHFKHLALIPFDLLQLIGGLGPGCVSMSPDLASMLKSM